MEEKSIKIKKSSLYVFGILFILALGGIFMIQTETNTVTGNQIDQDNQDFQEVVIGMRNYNYFPNTVKVKAGIPIKMSLDETVAGCFRDLTIRELGIHEYLINTEDSIEFVIPKPGTYTFSCSMGMGSGKIIAE